MKRLVVVLGGLLALPAFAEVAPFYYDDVTEFADAETIDDGVVFGDEFVAEKDAVRAPVVQSSRAGSRVVPVVANSNAANRASVNNSRAVAARGTASRATVTNGRGSASRAVVSRANGANTARVTTRRSTNSGASTARAAANQTTTKSIVQTDTVSTPLYTGRVGMRSAGSAVRSPSISVSSSSTTTTATSVADATSAMDSLAEMTDYCKAQYMACMDNFCNVLDDNQGRCTCSKNVKNYEKTETALRTATEELQDVAQRIQYIGLTSDEIVTLFTQTEAELAMQNNSDSTKLKNDLDRIKNMIVDVKGGSASAVGDTSGISVDLSNLLSFNIDSTGFDLTSLFSTTAANTSAITNQRGEALYKSASSRCKAAVLNTCAAQGVDTAVISNAYDMEIDKQCIVYERALTDANSQMIATVRNAKTVLQKARLMVAQQKNQYDLRGCISALDSCMQDDYVCGTDYESCLDPSGKYIVNGEVVVGSMPGMSGGSWGAEGTALYADRGLYRTWNTRDNKNVWAPSSSNTYTVADYLNDTISLDNARKTASMEMATFLQNKMGYHDDNSGRNYGMCISILNKCQDYTYESGKYVANNKVVNGWLERAFHQIKVAQDNVLSNYAGSCLSDVNACLSQNNYAFGASSGNNYSDMAIRACLPVINTCRSVTLGLDESSVNVSSLSAIYDWLDAGIATTYKLSCENTGGTWGASTGVCECSGDHMSQDSSKRTCVCDSGYEFGTNASTGKVECQQKTTISG